MPAGVARHDLQLDAELLVALLNSHGKGVVVTSEIEWLSRRIGRRLVGRVEVRPLPDPKWTVDGSAK